MLKAARFILFMPIALIIGIYLPPIILEVNFFLENILNQYEGDILFFIDGKVWFLYLVSIMAGGSGGAGLLYAGLYIAPKRNKLIVGCLVSLSILINFMEVYAQAMSDSGAVLKGAALLVPIFSLIATLASGHERIVEYEKILKSSA